MSHNSQWPKDDGEAGQFFEQARELVASLPVRAEPQYLPRLSPIRWAAMAFVNLNHPTEPGQTPDQLVRLADELRALADAMPDGGAEALLQTLKDRAAELAGKAVCRRYTETAAQAEGYLEGAPGAAKVLARLHELLSRYETEHKQDEDDAGPQALRPRLYKELLRRQAIEQAAVLRDRWETARKLEHSQPALYEASARMLLQQVVSAQVALVLEDVTAPVHDELERELRSAVEMIEAEAAERAEKRQGQALVSYQRWTLSAIRAFDTEVTRIERKATGLTSRWNNLSPWDYQSNYYVETGQYREVREAMIKHLTPVNLALLDLPVHERYQRAFQTGWRKLEGRDDQTMVARASAVVEKTSLKEFLENGS